MSQNVKVKGYGDVILVNRITDIPDKAYYDGDDKDIYGNSLRVYCLDNKKDDIEIFYGIQV